MISLVPIAAVAANWNECELRLLSRRLFDEGEKEELEVWRF